MDSNLDCDSEHFVGPGGAIYAMVCKSPRQSIDSNNNRNSKKDKQLKGFADDVVYAEISSDGKPSSEPPNETKQHSNGESSAIHNQDSHSHSVSNGLKFNAFDSSNIYEDLADLHPTTSSSVTSKAMSSEEAAKLQDLLSDLLGMADDFCGKLSEKKTEEVLKSEDVKDVNINHTEFKNFKTASADSGFYQQLSHDDDNNASCIRPSKYLSIHPSNNTSLHPSSDIYNEPKLVVDNESVPNKNNTFPESQRSRAESHFKERPQDFDSLGDGDARRKETSDKATETEDDFKSSINPGSTENVYSFLGSKPTPLTNITDNFRDQHHNNFNSYTTESFATPLPEYCFSLNGSKVMKYSETPHLMVGTDEYRLADHKTNLNHEYLLPPQPSETLNFAYHPKSISSSAHNISQTFHKKAPTCFNCNMNFDDHPRHMCYLDDGGDDDDDDVTSLHTETILYDLSESINSLIDIDTPYAEQLAIRLVCSSRDGRMEEKRKSRGRKNHEVVTLEPIGIGMQVLESERQTFPNTVDNRNLTLPCPPPLTPRCGDFHNPKSPRFNDFDDSKFSCYPINFLSQPSTTTRHHTTLTKSISSGYHERGSGTAEEWEDSAYYSPQPARTDFALEARKTIPTASIQQFQVQTINTLRTQPQNSASCSNFQTNHRFRQNNSNNNNNNNSRLPSRLRQKLNNNINNNFNNSINTNFNTNFNNSINNNFNTNFNNSINNNFNNNSKNNNHIDHDSFRFQYQKSPPSNIDRPIFPPKEIATFRSLQFSPHQPLKGSYSLQIPAKEQIQGEAGFEELCTTMPRSMRLLNPKYHQISEPQLFRNYLIDSNLNPLEVMAAPCFVTDQSKRWYHPNMSREQAINLLLDKPAGSFIVRDSKSFEGAYGLVVKVDKLPEQVINASPFEFVRHFLIETTAGGVRIKGSPREPTFGSLSNLVYQHMLTPLSLPCPLVLCEIEDDLSMEHNRVDESISQIIEETFYYVNGENTEGLTGPVSMVKAISLTFNSVCTTHFKVTKVKLRLDNEGISLTDLERKLFFRKKYPWNCISYSGIDNSPKVFFAKGDENSNIFLGRLFCIVARGNPLVPENTCHILACTKPQDHNFINIVETINDKISRTN